MPVSDRHATRRSVCLIARDNAKATTWQSAQNKWRRVPIERERGTESKPKLYNKKATNEVTNASFYRFLHRTVLSVVTAPKFG